MGKWKDKIPGGKADKKKPEDFDQNQLSKGKKVEKEHTPDPDIATEIAMDHLEESKDTNKKPGGKYYDKLDDMEKKVKKDIKSSSYFDMFKMASDLKKIAKKHKSKKHKSKKSPDAILTAKKNKKGDEGWPKKLKKGRFTNYCKRNGFKGPSKACADKALKSDNTSVRGMASFYLNTVKP